MEESKLATLQRQRDRLLAQKTILLTARGKSDQPEMGVTPFIRTRDDLFIYPPSVGACACGDGARAGAVSADRGRTGGAEYLGAGAA